LAGCETYQESKDIGKFPGNQEQIGLDEKKIPENDVSLIRGSMDKNLHGGQQTVLAGEYQERSEDQGTGSACMMAPEHDLGLLGKPTEGTCRRGPRRLDAANKCFDDNKP
jgi:hypothetical protein